MKFSASLILMLTLQSTLAFAACDKSQSSPKPTSGYVLKGATAYDKAANLTWQRCSVGQTWQEGKGCVGTVKGLTWIDAKALEDGGWRVPTIDELKTLVSPACSKPALNDEVFPGMDKESFYYWSSTEPRNNSIAYLDFATGGASADAPSEPYSVRMVRTGQ